jgi:hypothetical protein
MSRSWEMWVEAGMGTVSWERGLGQGKDADTHEAPQVQVLLPQFWLLGWLPHSQSG